MRMVGYEILSQAQINLETKYTLVFDDLVAIKT